MSNRPGSGRSSGGVARVVAPLALIVFAMACFAVVSAKDSSNSNGTPAAKSSARKTTKSATSANGAAAVTTKKSYTVKAGDSFAAIAEKLNINVDTLAQLNSDVDPRALQPGQKLKLR